MSQRHRLGLDLDQFSVEVEQEDRAVDVIEVDKSLTRLALKRVDAAGDFTVLLLQSGYGVETFHAPLKH